jgi:hypothetical protein
MKYTYDSSVGIPTGYGLDGLGSIPGRGKIFFSTPQHLARIWGPPILLSSEYLGLFPRGYSDWGVKLTIDLHLVKQYLRYMDKHIYDLM